MKGRPEESGATRQLLEEGQALDTQKVQMFDVRHRKGATDQG